VVGTDVDERMLAAARRMLDEHGLTRVELVRDDLFASALPEAAFGLVHARFQLAPLGREAEQLAAYRRWLAPGGMLVLEDPDSSTWGFDPPAPAAEELIERIRAAFAAAGGDFDAGVDAARHARSVGVEPEVRRVTLDLEPGHPYLSLPLQFATSLGSRLGDVTALVAEAERELADPTRGGITFTLVQAFGRVS
jgi:SAM-dependent methyltransferase